MSFANIALEEKQRILSEFSAVKADFASRSWFPGTSGNLSMRVGPYTPESFYFAVTASGKDKTKSTPEDFLFVDQDGIPCETTGLKPSAETSLHREIYRLTGAGAIFHIHSVFNNLVSELYWERRSVPIEGVELIKAFNIWEEDAVIEVPIVPNYADVPRIVPEIAGVLNARVPGLLIRKHGVCVWGRDASEAKKHLEAFEFLFEYAYRWQLLKGGK
ncbi:methylthioribulose 1-phosphate dehydratase [Cohnella endophytica]|uniref:Methylthioribulose-1-phosphate dehydratase n=1 Tax=Cohnella endophytica TaxID=2419778 RepID=A0A494Y9L6_9BACL|nr:methylthioribulose 1-phosphate dehydratase [Cohnella endophytica]RKP57008.1 methylthioribulose 1-phosphate dehydratase [Cohnella endophytica]